jgi:hypothetical protein
MSRFIDWLLHRHKPVLTGVYPSGTIFPHTIHPPVMVGARIARRLENTDRVQFVAIERADGRPGWQPTATPERPPPGLSTGGSDLDNHSDDPDGALGYDFYHRRRRWQRHLVFAKSAATAFNVTPVG